MLPPNGRIDAYQPTFPRDRFGASPRHDGGFDGDRCRRRLGARRRRHRPARRRGRRHSACRARGLSGLLQAVVREDLFTNPRPVPGRLAPMLAGSALIALALPVFVIAGWPLKGWALTAVLWTAAQALGYLLTRLPLDEGNLAASGVRGIGMGFRAFIVGIPLVAFTVADSRVGVAAVILYALAYTLELAVSLVTFFGSEVHKA